MVQKLFILKLGKVGGGGVFSSAQKGPLGGDYGHEHDYPAYN